MIAQNTMDSSSSSSSISSEPGFLKKPSNSNSNSSWNIIKNPANGRTRISQACDRCRARKIKCSGKSENNPRCTNCEKDGFQCVVSDKLTRNSFPKGYTKNLEKKLLDVELDRNRLLLELNDLKAKFANYEDLQSAPMVPDHSTTCTVVHQLNGTHLEAAEQGPVKHEYNMDLDVDEQAASCKVLKVDNEGLLIVDQSLRCPLTTHFTQLSLNSFNGYETVSSVSNSSKRKLEKPDEYDPKREDEDLKILSNYHMNLNRYLNLILYKLIFPLFSQESRNKAKSSNVPDKNLDHLIWLFFNEYNKLIPILDFELFYNDYLNFINKYTIQNSTYLENGEVKKKFHDFNIKEQDLLVKLILILKFTLSEPKHNSQSCIPNRQALNQFDESVKLINTKNLRLLIKDIDFTSNLTLDKFEIGLMLFYYLLKFENCTVLVDENKRKSKCEFLREILQLNMFMNSALNLNKSSDNLSFTNDLSQQLKMQRLKLYWDFRILCKLFQTYFTMDISNVNFENDANKPKGLESIKLINSDIEITLNLFRLFDRLPTNFMHLISENSVSELEIINESLDDWAAVFRTLGNDENSTVANKLKTYFYYLKIMTNLHNADNLTDSCTGFINVAYDLVFVKSTDVSVNNTEVLSLNSFNFHIMSLLSIINLKDTTNKELNSKLRKMVQIYQLFSNLKLVDNAVDILVKYIKDNVSIKALDDPIQSDGLKLFSYNLSSSTSLFDRKTAATPSIPAKELESTTTFDLSAFQMPSDSKFSTSTAMTAENSNKRHKSASPSSPSSVFSSLSSVSRDSSLSSRRLSGSSNDAVPSLFASAAAPATPELLATKKRRNTLFDTFSQSINGSLNNGLRKLRSEQSNGVGSASCKRSRSYSTSVTIDEQREQEHESLKLQSESRSQSECGTVPPSAVEFGSATGSNDVDSNNQLLEDVLNNGADFLKSEGSIFDEPIFKELQKGINNNNSDNNNNNNNSNNNNNNNSETHTRNGMKKTLETIPSEGNIAGLLNLSKSTVNLLAAAASSSTSSSSSSNNTDNSNTDPASTTTTAEATALFATAVSPSFSKAFKKSPVNPDSNVFAKPRTTSFRDDDDLNKLKERVMNLKSGVST